MSDGLTEPVDPVSPAGRIYLAITDKLLTAEFDRRKAFESRAAALLGSSGTMLTLIFGITVLVTGDGKDAVYQSAAAVGVLIAAMAAFLLSAVLAIVVQAHGFEYDVLSNESLTSLARDDTEWARRADDATRAWVGIQASTICTMRKGNRTKAAQVAWSLWIQVVAVTLLSASVGAELVSRLCETQPFPVCSYSVFSTHQPPEAHVDSPVPALTK
ncbi:MULTISPECIES: hypothetical protein [Mycobacteriaceae]|uniref:Uncharacterized protein n=1 Tax=Mycolicibacterium neoaurum VKM Ac-1815D TaxID=700508 RepID=V5XJ61_MYCNE|nr:MULTISPECIES: hypothetical protein [Mycobacteriaceae]AHC27811.1 hypothetical protein D174_04160 [Mycolicibacterium neoaurum VKM Ac-1815D]AMO04501.1 hypothetical protein MyAD_04075 [Mycolicibacterium neoaurum]AXK77211.1 hypothetical protein DXK33_21050 [Mycolicibacterium neoaurum]KJQ48524.1 hypothetical protein TS71_20655 [Mycolicibacterium neoaurum]KUM06910.1 hypothetical protein AVZ31_18825 [Mycolicibacterium neoaurum]